MKHTVKYTVCVCAWKRWMGVQSGVLQGLGTAIVKPPLILSLSQTHTHNSLPYLCSEVLCNREETRSRSTLALKWRRLCMSGGYSHQLGARTCTRGRGAVLVKQEGRRSRQASISPLMVEGGVLSSTSAAKVIYPLLLKSQIITGTERGGAGLLSSSRSKNVDCSYRVPFGSKQVLNLSYWACIYFFLYFSFVFILVFIVIWTLQSK